MKTRSAERGNSTLAVEVTNVSPNGIWLLFDEQERFLPFALFPWFEHATIAQISRVQRPARHHGSPGELRLSVQGAHAPGVDRTRARCSSRSLTGGVDLFSRPPSGCRGRDHPGATGALAPAGTLISSR